MPRYEYKCRCCNVSVIVSHDVGEMSEVCPQCNNENTLERVYSFNIQKSQYGKNKPGVLVKSHIEEARRELKKEKEKLSKKEFKYD